MRFTCWITESYKILFRTCNNCSFETATMATPPHFDVRFYVLCLSSFVVYFVNGTMDKVQRFSDSKCDIPPSESLELCAVTAVGRLHSEPGGTRRHTGGVWRGNRRMEWVPSTIPLYLGTWSVQHYYHDPHSSTASSRLNWRPHRLKWTRPFRGNTKSGFCVCAITFRTSSNNWRAKVLWWEMTTDHAMRHLGPQVGGVKGKAFSELKDA